MCGCACVRTRVYVSVCVHGSTRVGVWECVCACVRECVRACVCVSYLHSLLTLIRKPTQHLLFGSVSHFTPIVNKNIRSRCFFLCLHYFFGTEVYDSFDLVLDQTQTETLCDS